MSSAHLNFVEAYFTNRQRTLNGSAVATWLPEQFGSYSDLAKIISTREVNLKLDSTLKADSSGAVPDSTKLFQTQLTVNHAAAIKRAMNMIYGQRPIHSAITNTKLKHDDFMRSADYGNRVTVRVVQQQNASIEDTE